MPQLALTHTVMISIHAPREGCDPLYKPGQAPGMRISIHAPREGCDGRHDADLLEHRTDFNPRTP